MPVAAIIDRQKLIERLSNDYYDVGLIILLLPNMPPPSSSSAFHLVVLPKPFFVVKLEPGQEIAPYVIKDLTGGKSSFFSVTRTTEEVSVVGEAYTLMPSSYREQSTWSCIKIQGPMEHSMLYFLYDY